MVFGRSSIGLFCAALTLIVGSLTINSALAEPKVRSRKIECPAVIADKRDGTYQIYNSKSKKYPFECYGSIRDAKRGGFQTTQAILGYNFTGWYRLRLKLIKDSCDNLPHQGHQALFLQIKQTNDGLFGDFCPSFGELSGIRAKNRMTISGIEDIQKLTENSMCTDGKVRRHQYVELSRVVDGSAAYVAKLRQIESCTTAGETEKTCSREYSGIGFLETHMIWPKVPEAIGEMPDGCTMALTTCEECHPGINGTSN